MLVLMWVVFKLVITVHDAPNLCVYVKNPLNALFLLLCECFCCYASDVLQ